MNHGAFKGDSAARKYLGAQKNEVSDHLGGVRPSTESKFASSLFCAVILITHSLVHFSVGEEKLIHTREDEL